MTERELDILLREYSGAVRAVSVIGKNHGSLPLGGTSRYDVQSRVKLFRADGTELAASPKIPGRYPCVWTATTSSTRKRWRMSRSTESGLM